MKQSLAFIGFIAVALSYVFVMSKSTNEDGAGAMMMGLLVWHERLNPLQLLGIAIAITGLVMTVSF